MKFTNSGQNLIKYHLKVISIGIENLEACINLDLKALGGQWNKAQWEYELSNSSNLCFGIIHEEVLIAISLAWFVSEELNITALAIDPSFRRNGLGEKLLSHLLDHAKTLGVKTAILEVKSTNEPAKNLYQKYRFKMFGTRNNYYRDGSDALLFRCNFNNP